MNDELNVLWVKPGQRRLITNNFLEHQSIAEFATLESYSALVFEQHWFPIRGIR